MWFKCKTNIAPFIYYEKSGLSLSVKLKVHGNLAHMIVDDRTNGEGCDTS